MKPRRTSQAGPAWIALSAALMLILLAGCTSAAPSASTSPSTPIQTTARSATSAASSPSASPLDTTNWTPYESKQYGFTLKHPPGWTVWPAARDWTLEADAGQPGMAARKMFVTPADDLYVAVWSTPVNDTPETPDGIAAWVKQYCKQAQAAVAWTISAAVQRDGL